MNGAAAATSTMSWGSVAGIGLLVATVLVQLALGADVLVLALSVTSVMLGLYPIVYLGRDIYTCFAALFTFRYAGGVLFAKTLYGQPVDSLLREPLSSYALAMVLIAVVVGLTMLARRWDRGTTVFPALGSLNDVRQVGLLAYLVGAAAGVIVGLLVKRDVDGANTGAVFVIASALMNLVYLGYASEIIYNVHKTNKRSLISTRLAGMLAFTISLALFLNVRSIAVNSVLCIFFAAFLLRALRIHHLGLGLVMAFVFSSYVSPLALELRTIKEGKTATEFASEVVELVSRTVTEPGLIGELQRKEAFRSRFDSGTSQYDYFGDGSNILNRLAFVALLDSVYSQTKVLNPIGTKALTDQVIPRIMPGFLVEKEARAYGYGDWLSWELGIAESGRISFLSFPLPVEGVAVFGPLIGVTIWPFMLMLPMLLVLGRVSSLLYITPTSLFLLSALHWDLVEALSDGYIAMLTRGLPITVIPAWCLYWFWGQRSRAATASRSLPAPGGQARAGLGQA